MLITLKLAYSSEQPKRVQLQPAVDSQRGHAAASHQACNTNSKACLGKTASGLCSRRLSRDVVCVG